MGEKELIETSRLIFFSKEHLSARPLFTQIFTHTMADEGKAVKPPLIGEEVIPESLRLHSTIPIQTATKNGEISEVPTEKCCIKNGSYLI